jgi:hypothetical protein
MKSNLSVYGLVGCLAGVLVGCSFDQRDGLPESTGTLQAPLDVGTSGAVYRPRCDEVSCSNYCGSP